MAERGGGDVCTLAGDPVESPSEGLFPTYKQKFKSQPVKAILREVLNEKLVETSEYHPEESPLLSKQIASEIRDRLKDLEVPRYKIIVNVILGEQRGHGVRIGRRCFWDENTDSVASESFINDHLFCVVTAYAIYAY
ncbi:tctex2-related light chain [Cystoisospora suis]|uniref:Tctex2-related light chain n=1 Tax=Cystoisospora suis TaxID=483139 RepID=A0A2C6KZ47_9APIC|nr:tctex2-related light chain [Cystoisospora suis]